MTKYKVCKILESGTTSGISYSIYQHAYSVLLLFSVLLSLLYPILLLKNFLFSYFFLVLPYATQLYETTEDVLLFCTKGSATCVLITLLTYYYSL